MNDWKTYQFIYKQFPIDTLSTDEYQDAIDFQAHLADIRGIELEDITIVEHIDNN